MKGKKGFIVLLAVVLVIGTFSTGFAQTSMQTIKGWFDKDIKVYNNGVRVNLKETPIIHQKDASGGGTTYVAIRELAELLDKDVTWDQANYSAYIVDRPDQNQQELLRQLIERQEQVKTLEAKVADLEKKLEEAEKKEDKVSDLKDLQKYLNDKYGIHRGVRVNIVLKGDKDDVKVDAVISTADRNDWDYLSSSRRKELVEDLVDEIRREYTNPKITGYVDAGYKDTSIEFSVDTRGNIKYSGIDTGSGKYLSATEMARYLEKKYDRDVSKVSVTVRGYNVDVVVDLDYDLYNDEIRDLVYKMEDDIVYEMKDVKLSDIDIKVYYGNQLRN